MVVAGEGDHLGGQFAAAAILPRMQFNHCLDLLAEFLVRYADNGDVLHCRMLDQRILDFLRDRYLRRRII